MVFSRTLIVVRRDTSDLKPAPFLSATHSGVTLSTANSIFVHYFKEQALRNQCPTPNHSKASLGFLQLSLSGQSGSDKSYSQSSGKISQNLNGLNPMHLALSSFSPWLFRV